MWSVRLALIASLLTVIGVFQAMELITEKHKSLRREAHYGLRPGTIMPTSDGISESRVTLVSWLPSNIANKASLKAQETRKKWAEHHGYTFMQLNEANIGASINATSHYIKPFVIDIAIGKIKNGDWLLWMDADVIITNKSIPIHPFIKNRTHVMLTEGTENHINSGVFALKKSEASLAIIREWCLLSLANTGWAEQELFIESVLTEQHIQAGVPYDHTCGPYVLSPPINRDFGEFRGIFTSCVRAKLQKLGPISTHPITGACGTTSVADSSIMTGLWGVNFMGTEWRRGDLLIHLAGSTHPFRELITHRMTQPDLPYSLYDIYWKLMQDRITRSVL